MDLSILYAVALVALMMAIFFYKILERGRFPFT